MLAREDPWLPRRSRQAAGSEEELRHWGDVIAPILWLSVTEEGRYTFVERLIRDKLAAVCPEALAFMIQSFGIYLGMAVGPGAADHSLDEPFKKYLT